VDYRSVPVAEGFERAKAYARQALQLDDSLAEAHASLAWTLFIYDWDWEAAGREFRRAIALDPAYATARQWHAFLLAARGAMDEALAEAHRAVELDPTSVSARRGLGWANVYARRYDQVRAHLNRAIAMNPTAVESYRILGLSLALQGNDAEAERVLREAMELPASGAYTQATLAYHLGRTGREAEARELLQELERAAQADYVSPVAFATIYIGLGDLDRALDWAERAYAERRGWLAYVKVNPIMDPLRDSPRFAALVRKMRL
jgi:Tfp pilus assembly protein PilF